MTTEQFLLLNISLLIFFAVLFLWGRRGPRAPSKLKLTSWISSSSASKSFTELPPKPSSSSFQDLNPVFMYNGHTWDAYEVLGVPPGSSIEVIKEAFEKSIQKTDPGSHDFLKLALTALLSEMKNRGYRP